MKKTFIFLIMVMNVPLFAGTLDEDNKENSQPNTQKQTTGKLVRPKRFNANHEQGIIYDDQGKVVLRFKESVDAFLARMQLKTYENPYPASQDLTQ